MNKMKRIMLAGGFLLSVSTLGCATSGQEQQRALAHQENSDNAAANGQYKVAGAEQRAAEDAHHKATTKAIDEGKTLPPQTKMGDRPSSEQN